MTQSAQASFSHNLILNSKINSVSTLLLIISNKSNDHEWRSSVRKTTIDQKLITPQCYQGCFLANERKYRNEEKTDK